MASNRVDGAGRQTPLPVALPPGTRIRVERLFARVPLLQRLVRLITDTIYELMITVEESGIGGFGSHVALTCSSVPSVLRAGAHH